MHFTRVEILRAFSYYTLYVGISRTLLNNINIIVIINVLISY